MASFAHLRHKPATPLKQPRELCVAVPAMRSTVNLSRIVRAAGCCGVQTIIAEKPARVNPKIARDSVAQINIQRHRSLAPVLATKQEQGYRLVGLEQTDRSTCLFNYRFANRTVLVLGNERLGITEGILDLLDDAVEIPVYGRPFSFNVATAAAMALYEYCRQYPAG